MGVCAIPAELPHFSSDKCSRSACRHLVAGNRGAILSGLGPGGSVLLLGADNPHGYRRHLSLSRVALLPRVTSCESLFECILPPGWADGGITSGGCGPEGKFSALEVHNSGVDFFTGHSAARISDSSSVAGLFVYCACISLSCLCRAFFRTEVVAAGSHQSVYRLHRNHQLRIVPAPQNSI